MDVIDAARKISDAGTKLNKLGREIANQCPESSTKTDLLAYLERINTFCSQINITAKVKADIQNVSGELVVTGVSLFINNFYFINNLSCFEEAKNIFILYNNKNSTQKI